MQIGSETFYSYICSQKDRGAEFRAEIIPYDLMRAMPPEGVCLSMVHAHQTHRPNPGHRLSGKVIMRTDMGVTSRRSAHPVMLSVAASDSCGGAGIQADIKTATSLGVYAASAVTAITVQDTLCVHEVIPVGAAIVARQIEVVWADIRPRAIKIGLLPTPGCVEAVAHTLRNLHAANIVLDPVAIASSGHSLALGGEAHLAALAEKLLPACTLVTPNYPEMKAFLGHEIISPEESCREFLARYGCGAVCLKGGHSPDSDLATDVLAVANGGTYLFSKPRIRPVGSHGTGCAFSSAAAAFLASGYPLARAVELASLYTTSLLAAGSPPAIGHGQGCMSFHIKHFNIPDHTNDSNCQ